MSPAIPANTPASPWSIAAFWQFDWGRRVGYSVLKSDAPSGDTPGRFVRRVFRVKDYDRSEQPDGTYKRSAPSEAVDPRTVAPGVWGELTERAWGSPLPD
ncbi:DUF6009 family protein [Streptomyces sp. NPDC002467]|uniref:DUF6009 family protein n=1 Tax=Streptomyces sp. NPDC002467 TaxID=3364647 RepID=UPI0036B16E55